MPCLPRQSKRPGGSMLVVNRTGRNRDRVSKLCYASVSALALIAAALTSSPARAETAAQPNQGAGQLPRIDVRAPRPAQRQSNRPGRRAQQSQRGVPSPGRGTVPEPPETAGPAAPATPLNTNTVAT